MKKIQIPVYYFQCERCGTIYGEALRAEACESECAKKEEKVFLEGVRKAEDNSGQK